MEPSELGALTPLSGGWSGETFRAETGGAPLVVRIYAREGMRGAAAAEVDAALLRLVRGLVPVPEVVEVRRPDSAAGTPGLLVTSWVDGVRGDELLPTLDGTGLAILGRLLGELAADLGGMPMLSAGPFVDADLALGDFGGADLTEYAHAGHPATDLGNLLRFERHPAYVAALLAAYCLRRGGDPDDVLEQARAADLWALVDLASRAGENPVADRAERLLHAIAASRDLHAVPAGWTHHGAPA